MTIEAPAGLTPTELRAWADNPIGGRVAYGFNYGVPLVSKTITEKNHEKTMADWSKRMANGGAWAKGTRQGRMKVRASVTPQKIGAVRRKINKEGFKMAEEIKLKRTRARKAVTERNLDLKPQKGQTFNDFLSSATSSKTAKQKFALEKKRIGKAEVFMPKTTLSKKKVGKANVFMPSGKTNLLK